MYSEYFLLSLLFNSRPVAGIFYGEVRSHEETERTWPEGGVGGRGGRLAETAFQAFWKTGYFSNF